MPHCFLRTPAIHSRPLLDVQDVNFEEHLLLGGVPAEAVVQEMQHSHRIGATRDRYQVWVVFLHSYMSRHGILEPMHKYALQTLPTNHILLVLQLGFLDFALVARPLQRDVFLFRLFDFGRVIYQLLLDLLLLNDARVCLCPTHPELRKDHLEIIFLETFRLISTHLLDHW